MPNVFFCNAPLPPALISMGSDWGPASLPTTDLHPMKNFTSPLIALLAALTASSASAQIEIGSSGFCSGVANSTGVPSEMTAFGSTVVSQNDVTLSVTSLPPSSLGYFIVGPDPGAVFNPGGSTGTLCISGAIGRYAGNIMSTGATGEANFTVDLTSLPSPNGSVAVLPEDDWVFQFWHRDTSPAGPTSNFSPGLIIDFAPLVPTFSDDIWPILAQSNVGAPACIICHGSGGMGGLNMGFTPTMGYAALVNAQSTSPGCGGSTYVVPGNLGASLMYDKLSNTSPSCGSQMPFMGTLAGDLNIIRDWILGGAPF